MKWFEPRTSEMPARPSAAEIVDTLLSPAMVNSSEEKRLLAAMNLGLDREEAEEANAMIASAYWRAGLVGGGMRCYDDFDQHPIFAEAYRRFEKVFSSKQPGDKNARHFRNRFV